MDKGAASPRTRYRLEAGTDVLEQWSATAKQAERHAVYTALFAMLDGSLFRTYRIVDDFRRTNELFVLITDDLLLEIRINCLDSFSIVNIGDREDVRRPAEVAEDDPGPG